MSIPSPLNFKHLSYKTIKRALQVFKKGAVFAIIGCAILTPSKAATPLKMPSFAAAYLAARTAYSENNLDMAIRYYQEAQNFAPNNNEIQKDLFFISLIKGHFKDAVIQAEKLEKNELLERYPLLTLITDRLRAKRYTNLIPLLDKFSTVDVDIFSQTIIKGWVAFGRGNKEDALRTMEDTLKDTHYSFFGRYHLALLYDLLDKPTQAEEQFKTLIGRRDGVGVPDTYAHIIISYASFLIRHGQRQKALDLLTKGEITLGDAPILTKLRQKIAKGARPKPLIQTAQDGAGELFYNLGTALKNTNVKRFAQFYLQFAAVLRPTDEDSLFALAQINARNKEYPQASALYKRFRPLSPHYNEARLGLSIALGEMGHKKEAIAILQKLVKADQNNSRARLTLGAFYMDENHYLKTIQTLDEALKHKASIEGAEWLFHFQRAIAYDKLKQWPKAAQDLQQALNFAPERVIVLNYYGYRLLERNEDLEHALALVQKAADLAPDDSEIMDSLGWAYYKLGLYNKATTILERAVQKNPDNSTINHHLGDTYWQTGRQTEARFQWQRALANDPSDEERAQLQEKINKSFSFSQKLQIPH